MEIILRSDWDIPFQSPSKEQTTQTGHFVGRKAELSIFVNELLRREQGAILVTGYRGVGKTSFVYKALHELFKAYDQNRILFVLVNGNHLESDRRSGGPNPKSIIVNLIRRLYASAQNEKLRAGLKQDLESLYKKAVSADFKLSESVENNKKTSQETEISRQTEISAQQLSATQIIWLISFSFALITQVFPIMPGLVWLSKILPLLLAFPIPLLLSFAWKAGKKITTSEARTNSAQQLYTMDNSVNNLEFDLEKLHDQLRKEGIKTIYVLDELDKLDTDTIFDAMKYFKNLFTFSSALFVFVGGEELFLKYQNETRSNSYRDVSPDYRPLEYTYFSSKYFLARPSDVDLLNFLDEITYNYDKVRFEPAFEDYKRSLIFDAKGDFFDLIQVIKGNINRFDDIRPVLTHELNDNSKLKADLQRAVSALFNAKYASFLPINWLENENVIRRLYYEAQILLTKSPGQDVPGKPPDHSNMRPLITNSTLPDYAVDDFYRLLHRVGFLEFTGQADAKTYYRGTKVIGKISNYLTSLSELEEQLVSKIEKIYQIILNYCNFYLALQQAPLISFSDFKNKPQSIAYRMNLWGRDARHTLMEFEPVYESLTDLQPIKLDDVKKFTDDADSAIERLTYQPHDLLSNIFVDAYKDMTLEVTDLSQNPEILKPRPRLNNEIMPEERLGVYFSEERNPEYFGRNEIQFVGVPNQLLLSQNFAYPVIFIPMVKDSWQAHSTEQNEATVVACITGVGNITGFIFAPMAQNARDIEHGVNIILRLLKKIEHSK